MAAEPLLTREQARRVARILLDIDQRIAAEEAEQEQALSGPEDARSSTSTSPGGPDDG